MQANVQRLAKPHAAQTIVDRLLLLA